MRSPISLLIRFRDPLTRLGLFAAPHQACAVLGRPCAAHPPSRERPYMYWPPLGLSWEPVNQPPSVQRKRTTAAISSGSPKRPRGI